MESSVQSPKDIGRDKIIEVGALMDIAEVCRGSGRRLVLCHGVFDLLHMGHVRHFHEAKKFGDVLAVSITADEFVNKGPGRPAFPAPIRAEMLAALADVDWVTINDAPDAIELLGNVRPDIYAKGPDYAEEDEDVTEKIAGERKAVETGGGRLVTTDDVTFSSSSLINRHIAVQDPVLHEFLEQLRENGGAQRILELIETVSNYRVLLVGDAILDDYHYVEPMGKSPKENLVATQYRSREMFAGGVFAAANHVAGLCKQVDILTSLGTNPDQEAFIRECLLPNVGMSVLERPNSPTTTKRRYVSTAYLRKMFEVYYYNEMPLPGELVAAFNSLIAERAGDYDLIIVTDFGHGLIGSSTIETLVNSAKFLAVNAQSNSANYGYNLVTKYPRADFVCIDEPEARLATGRKHDEMQELIREGLAQDIACDRFIVTHGRNGCYTYDGGFTHVPALTDSVLDTVGAGDAFLSITSPLVAAGGRIEEVGLVGNIAGALKVQIVGHRKSVEKVSLMKSLTAILK